MRWIEFPNPGLELRGLPWHQENAPDLWRLPKRAKATTPVGAWKRSLIPDGGRIRLSCNTSRLAIRVQVIGEYKNPCRLDAYIAGELAGTGDATGTKKVELFLFKGKDRSDKDITIYLPNVHQVRVFAVAVDKDTQLGTPPAFAIERPLVFYGSSVLQGTGASRGAMTYPAILARKLNLDFVNLGFGGSGKAEPQVVALLNEIDACGFVFDLGKSYGAQPQEVYAKMLDDIRLKHPNTPIIVVTPIYSLRELKEPEYKEKSEKLRTLMRHAAENRMKAGDKHMCVVGGLDLFGERDSDAFHDPSHPNDKGNRRMAERLEATVKKAVPGL